MNTGQKLAYGLLGAPLAMAALPVYIYTPKLYGDEFGLGLALTGVILLGSRVVDTLQDPWLGRLANHMQRKPGGCSLPLWLSLSRRLGKTLTWVFGTFAAVTAFFWAVQLGPGDMVPYILICLLSGAALGADLALPAAIAADIIPHRDRGRAASYFGIWSLINKGVLALAAGLGLPLLAALGYQPGGELGLTALAVLYAGIPCLIKLLSAMLLLRWRSCLEVKHAA